MDAIDTFAILAREHQHMLQAYVLGLVRDPVLAQDLTQEAFLKAFQKLATLRTTESFPAWIRTIARRLACDHYAATAREIPTDPEVLQGMEDVFTALDSPARGDLWHDRLREVKGCFERLPPALRDVCRLHYFEDHQAQTIAQRLSLTTVTVWKRLERARGELRRCIEQRLGLPKEDVAP